MKLIPNICISDSEGEKKLFSILHHNDCLPGSVGLHSLNIARHVSKAEGEADFVLIVPEKGILVVEVKDHEKVKYEDGKWMLGNERPTAGGPIKQAREAMYSLIDFIKTTNQDFARIPIGFCVWFTRTEFNPKDIHSIEWEEWQIVDVNALKNPQKTIIEILDSNIKRLQSSSSTRHIKPELFSAEIAQRIISLLRPRFETVIQESTLRKMRRDELTRLIEDQYDAIDGMEENPRVLVTGPAGTGKTLLALEKVRRLRAQGKSTIYVCFNNSLQSEVAANNIDVQTITISKLMSNQIRKNSKDIHDSSINLENRLKEVNLGEDDKFDAIVLDEAQDLFSAKYLPWIDKFIKGGLKEGNWFAFGDFQGQNLYSSTSEHNLIEEYCDSISRYSLRHNCRNLPNIGHLTYSIVKNAPRWTSFRRGDDGIDPIIKFTERDALLTEELNRAIEYFKIHKYSYNDIVVLTPSRIESPSSTFSTSRYSERFVSWSINTNGKIRFSTIHSFKGLESPCVILLELYDLIGNPDWRHLMYTALTRATDRLYVVADPDSRRVLESV